MSKKIINDITNQPNAANSSMLEGENKPRFLTRKTDEESKEGRKEMDEYFKERKTKRFAKPAMYVGGLIVLIIIFFVASNLFASARVAITPRGETLTLDEKVTLEKNPSEGTLGFSVATVQAESETLVSSTGTKRVERKATGRIAIFNNFSDKPFKLIANTRFERPDGKIYKIQNSVSVPGLRIVAGKTVPGSLEVTVTAAEPGAEYNGDPTDFTVPGLKGDPSFDKIFARSVTALSGGYAGDVYVISKDEKGAARTTLEAELDTALREKLKSQITSDMFVFENSIEIRYGELEEPPVTGEATSGKVPVKSRGTLRALVLSLPDLAQFLAKEHIADWGGEGVAIKNPALLGITTQASLPNDLDALETLLVTIKGPARIEWIFSVEELKNKLAGVKKAAATKIFAEFPPIEGAKIYMIPPWARSFPKQVEKITIEVTVATVEQ